jgi:hypothetical protein
MYVFHLKSRSSKIYGASNSGTLDIKMLGLDFVFMLNSALKCVPRTMSTRGRNVTEHVKQRCLYRGLPPRKLVYTQPGAGSPSREYTHSYPTCFFCAHSAISFFLFCVFFFDLSFLILYRILYILLYRGLLSKGDEAHYGLGGPPPTIPEEII